MASPRTAAIVPVYNRPEAVLEAIASITAQSTPPALLVVVDDGSTDATATVVDEWIEAHPPPFEARVLRQANAGAAAARNRGAADAGDLELLAFLDSDDLWPPDYLARMEQALAAEPGAVAASCDRLDVDLAHGTQHRRDLSAMGTGPTRTMLAVGPPGTPNTVVRRAHFDAVGGYDAGEACGEDYQLMLRLSLRGPWLHVPGAPVTVRRNLGGEQSPPLSRRFDDRRLRLARILERFVHEEGGADAVPDRDWRRRLGRLWYAAGRQASRGGDPELARRCFARAVANEPRHLRARWRHRFG